MWQGNIEIVRHLGNTKLVKNKNCLLFENNKSLLKIHLFKKLYFYLHRIVCT